jgi:hypothetical protein
MSDITLERTAHAAFWTALLAMRCRLATVLAGQWDEAVRQAERPGRYVPYC